MIVEKQINNTGLVWAQQTNQFSNSWVDDIYTNGSGRLFIRSQLSLWYSDDNGLNWTQSTRAAFAEYEIIDVCITKTGRLIASIYTDYSTEELLISDDNGETWASNYDAYNSGLTFCQPVFYVTPAGRILLSDTDHGIWYSDDNGENWAQSNILGGTTHYLFLNIITSTGRLFIGEPNGTSGINKSGIWYSDDNGETWTQSNFPTNKGIKKYACITQTGRIIVSTNNGGIWYSDDNGVNWVQFTGITGGWNGSYASSANRLFAYSSNNATKGIWYSDDNGETWARIINNISCVSIVKLGNKIIAGTNKGIWYSDIVTGTKKNDYSSKPLTGAQARQLVAECKAYVQELKQS